MKSIILSCTPFECEKIVNGNISILVRKKVPNETPFKVYVCCASRQTDAALFIEKETKKAHHIDNYRKAWAFDGYHITCFLANGKVIGEFICNKVDEYPYDYCDGVDIDDDTILETAIEREDINIYAKGKPLYGLHISDLKIYDEPQALSCFYKQCPKNTTCSTCDWFHVDWHTFGECSNTITRPPKNYIYVEE